MMQTKPTADVATSSTTGGAPSIVVTRLAAAANAVLSTSDTRSRNDTVTTMPNEKIRFTRKTRSWLRFGSGFTPQILLSASWIWANVVVAPNASTSTLSSVASDAGA